VNLKISHQYKGAKWWGMFKNLGQHVTFYVTGMVLMFSAMTAYSTTIFPYLSGKGVNLPFWAFAVTMVALLGVMMLFEYKVTLPSFFTFWNEQWWSHNNPLRAEMAEVNKRLDAIDDALGIEHKIEKPWPKEAVWPEFRDGGNGEKSAK